jgi:HD-GYP domain-containing protein (c-di-GMP phosphodiesterase class II)
MASGSSPILEPDASLASLLCALSFASGLALGDRMEHGLGTAYIGLRLADMLGLGDAEREAVYYGALVKDAGCTACASLLGVLFPDEARRPAAQSQARLIDRTRLGDVLAWLSQGVPDERSLPVRAARLFSLVAHCGPVMQEVTRSHCEVAELFARRLGFGQQVQEAVRFQTERWDGKGPAYGLKGNVPPISARIVHLAQLAELWHGLGGRAVAQTRVREVGGTRFDPDLAAAFLSVAAHEAFWRTLEDGSLHQVVLAMRPATAAELRTEAQLDSVCAALADFTDIRAKSHWKHSSDVAETSVAIAELLGLGPLERRRARWAALLHDLGAVTVPVSVLDKHDMQAPLTEGEQDLLHLHSHYTQRLLERVGPLRDLAEEASADHEWVNGTGYHRRLLGDAIPLIGRIVAVADMYHAQASDRLGEWAPTQRLASLRPLVGRQLDARCFAALASVVVGGSTTRTGLRGAAPPDHLTDREIEVLRLLARGLSNPQIGETLVISRKTVEHHLEHIYNKLGISTRTAAVAYAVHRGLASP